MYHTDPPFQGKYWDNHAPGVYFCTECGAALFSSEAKFDSGSGWPSFDRPEKEKAIAEKSDVSHGMVRTEIICKKCGAHLGQLFDDGPTETGQRYCVNSSALDFKPKNQ